MAKKRRTRAGVKTPRPPARTAALMAAESGNPPAQTFEGHYRFPGKFAFLEKLNIADYALLQEDDPYTGQFDETTAEQTCVSLAEQHQNGDPAEITGKIVTCDVDGRPTPVLFMFD